MPSLGSSFIVFCVGGSTSAGSGEIFPFRSDPFTVFGGVFRRAGRFDDNGFVRGRFMS